MLTADQLRLFEAGPFAAHLATLPAELADWPDLVRVFGVSTDDEGRTVRIRFPREPGARALANVRANPQVSLLVTHMSRYESLQLKGSVIAIEEADEQDVQLARGVGRAYKQSVREITGLASVVGMRTEAEVALLVEVEAVYSQTPGPGAGKRLRSRSE